MSVWVIFGIDFALKENNFEINVTICSIEMKQEMQHEKS
jgi:hypothetical protein